MLVTQVGDQDEEAIQGRTAEGLKPDDETDDLHPPDDTIALLLLGVLPGLRTVRDGLQGP